MSVLGSFINLHTGSVFFFRGHCQRWDSWVTPDIYSGQAPLPTGSPFMLIGVGDWSGDTW